MPESNRDTIIKLINDVASDAERKGLKKREGATGPTKLDPAFARRTENKLSAELAFDDRRAASAPMMLRSSAGGPVIDYKDTKTLPQAGLGNIAQLISDAVSDLKYEAHNTTIYDPRPSEFIKVQEEVGFKPGAWVKNGAIYVSPESTLTLGTFAHELRHVEQGEEYHDLLRGGNEGEARRTADEVLEYYREHKSEYGLT